MTFRSLTEVFFSFRNFSNMNKFITCILFAVLSIITKPALGIADLNKPPKHCVMERTHRMVGYNCAKLELRDVPTNLKSSTEVSKLRW